MQTKLKLWVRSTGDAPPAMDGKRGGEVYFPNGEVWAVRSWEHAVGKVGEWAVTLGHIPESSLPVAVGDIVHGIHMEKVHGDGTGFHRSHEFLGPSGKKVYVHTHSGGSREASVERICRILELAAVDAETVTVRVH